MELKVDFQVKARFGKVDGARDYSWLMGQDATPGHLLSLSETLSQVVANGKTFLSLVTEAESAVWLIRAYISGVDNQYRPIAAAEVAQVLEPSPLPLGQWLGLAAISIQQPERELIGSVNRFSICIPTPHGEPATPTPDLIARARLGLPLTTTTRIAASLISPETWKYRGICFAVRGKNDPPTEWVADLSDYLCINFAEPPLSTLERELISIVQSRAISPIEWESLSRLQTSQLNQALQWSATDNGPLQVDPSDSALLQWLIVYRSTQYKGARLISRLRRDTTLKTLPPVFVEAATRELPEKEAAFLSAVVRGCRPRAEREVLEHLASEGFLEDELIVPLKVWVSFVAESPIIQELALRKLAALGYKDDAVSFVLNLDPISYFSNPTVPEGLDEAAAFAASIGLGPPKRRLLAALKAARTDDQISRLQRAALAYGVWGESLIGLWLDLRLPEQGSLNPREMLAAIEGRERFGDPTEALLTTLGSLLGAEQLAEATGLLEASEGSSAIRLSPQGRSTIRARLGMALSAAPPPIDEMARLVTHKLARPEDIELTEKEEPMLADYARLWQSTAPLAEVLSDERTALNAELPGYPPAWIGALRKALTPTRARCWMARLDAAHQDAARQWIARLHKLSPAIFGALTGGAAESISNAQTPPGELSWLPALFSSATHAQRLGIIAALARSGSVKGNEAAACSLVNALLPEVGETARGIAVHALSGIGPLPSTTGVSAEFVLAMLPALDALALTDAIFSSYDRNLSGALEFCRALAQRLAEQQSSCPPHGYTTEQIVRHAPMAHALSAVAGWEHLALNVEVRTRYVQDLMDRFGLRVADLFKEGREG